MKNKIINCNFFTIKKLVDSLNVLKFFSNKNPVTYNQIFKSHKKIAYLFLFNIQEPETPLLITYCNYFNIKLYLLNEENVEEIKKIIDFSRLACVFEEDKSECEYLDKILLTMSKSNENINLIDYKNVR